MNLVRAEIEGNRIYIESAPSDKESCQEVSGCRWDKQSRRWHCPLSWASCKALRAVFGSRLEIGPNLLLWASNELETRITPCMELREALSAEPVHPQAYPFQSAGARFMATSKHCLNSDPMGAGKSFQTIMAIKLLQESNGDALPALIICPNSVKRSWKREIEHWWPGIPAHLVEGTAAKRSKSLKEAQGIPGFVVINFEAVRLHSRLAPYGSIALSETEKTPKELNLIDWGTVVVDEGHRMADVKSKQTRAIQAIGQGL